MTDHAQDLADRAATYRARMDDVNEARSQLAHAVRAAFDDGMRKADILRAINHTWSREWLDRMVDER